MSASVYFQPIKGHRLVLGGPSSFLELLRRVTSSNGPWELDTYWRSFLEGAARGTEDNEHRLALEVLVEAIDQYGSIRVWAEY